MKYVPHEYQTYATNFILTHPISAILLSMGLGKSVITLTAILDLCLDCFEIRKVLVVGPLRVARDVWPSEIEKWDHLHSLTYSVAVGTEAERRAALRRNVSVYIINRENVQWLIEQSGLPFDYDMVVIDELSSFKSHQAQRFKSLMKVRARVKRIVGLTGTPASNGLMDLWAEFRLLDMGQRLGRFIGRYRETYFVPDRRNQQMVFSYKPRPDAEEEIYCRISDITISMKKRATAGVAGSPPGVPARRGVPAGAGVGVAAGVGVGVAGPPARGVPAGVAAGVGVCPPGCTRSARGRRPARGRCPPAGVCPPGSGSPPGRVCLPVGLQTLTGSGVPAGPDAPGKGGSDLYKSLAGDRAPTSRENPTNSGPGVFNPQNEKSRPKSATVAVEGGNSVNTTMNLQRIDVERLKPAKYNPRKDLKPGDPAYEKIKRSLRDFGYVDPVIWNEVTGNIVGGHQRYKVLTAEGAAEIDCVVVHIENPQDEKALNIALNKAVGEWEPVALADLLSDLQQNGYDLGATGFDAAEIDDLFSKVHDKDVQDDDCDIDPDEIKPFVQPGDVWTLGRHRLVCGDATKAEDVALLMDGVKANLVVTDPPYNVSYESADGKTIQNDSMADGKFYEFLLAAFRNMAAHMAEGGSAYIFHADTEGLNFRRAFKEAGFHISGVCIWAKNSLVLGRSPYQWQHEPILFGWLPNGKHKWFSDRKQSTVWSFDKPKRSAEHPTMKPIPLLAYPIKNSSAPNGVVLDLFGGSGSTLIACEQTDRICRTMELDPKYASVIVQRYVNQAGDAASVKVLRGGAEMSYSEVAQAE